MFGYGTLAGANGNEQDAPIPAIGMPLGNGSDRPKGVVRRPYSIISSARARIDWGTVRPSALAVLLMVDDKLKFGRLLDRQIGGLGAL
jgi:hypothetical protein